MRVGTEVDSTGAVASVVTVVAVGGTTTAVEMGRPLVSIAVGCGAADSTGVAVGAILTTRLGVGVGSS